MKAILKEMKVHGISQAELARKIGLDRTNVNKTLRGTERGVTIEQLIRLANGVGLDVEVIIKKLKDLE